MILLCDPRVAAVPAADDGDPLIDVRDVPQLRLDDRAADPHGAYALLRREVVDRLLYAQRSLPFGLRLLLVEGYRPPGAQTATPDRYAAELRRRHPDFSPGRVHEETPTYVSPVNVAPHSTGGAINLTLCTADGVELDMGTALGATWQGGGNDCFTGARHIPRSARWNRRIMWDALSRGGLVNYPALWWHWSYGDRYWALLTRAPRARYAPVRLTPLASPR
jgi:D-alanyl-D-alanine dipeptidase